MKVVSPAIPKITNEGKRGYFHVLISFLIDGSFSSTSYRFYHSGPRRGDSENKGRGGFHTISVAQYLDVISDYIRQICFVLVLLNYLV
jgi:hypothetical protein